MNATWETLRARPATALPLLMAHRGAADELPENTLAAFQRALQQGADVLETDIRLTADDEIILMHDASVDRTTDGQGVAAEMTLAQIKTLRARRSFQFSRLLGSEPVPTLGEFLDATPGAPVALELKDDRFIAPADAERLVTLLDNHHALDRIALLSFRRARLDACKRTAPTIPIGIITLKNPLPLYNTELMGPFYPLVYLNPFYFRWARQRGRIACPLDPAPEPRLRWYRALGAPILLTNHPAVTRRALDAL